MLSRSLKSIAALTLCWFAATARADEHAAVAPYLADDVSSVVYLDLAKFNFPAIAAELLKYNLIAEPHIVEAKQQTAAIQEKLDELTKLGARRAYLLVRVSDFFDGPTLVVEVAEEGQAQTVADWLARWAEKADALGDAAAYVPRKFVANGAVVVGAVTPERLEKVRAKREGAPRPEASAALTALDSIDAGWVGFGDADSRRVVREMFPQFPAPFMEIDGKLLADGLQWMAVTAKLPPDPTVTFAVQTAEPKTAAVLENSAAKGLTMAKGLLMAEKLNGPPAHKERAEAFLPLLAKLAPRSEDARLSITFGDDEEEKAILRDYLPKLLEGAQTQAQRTARMNQFKQIGLGMLNYESEKKSYPPAASYGPNGRQLLSWRVLILPYLGEQALYKEFRLDEPWDSEHNRKLIERMPAIYADPDRSVRAALEKGHTTFVVPVGEGLVFGRREGTAIREVKDGTSNTVLLVEVVPDRAAPWTQPADWEVDANNPLDGVKRSDREFFAAAFCDGSAHILQNSTEAAKLRAILTRAGNEVVNW